MVQIVLPGHGNNHGNAFGGQIAAWIDICAAVSAQRFARGPVVTAAMDELHFLLPVRIGMVVVLQSQVNQAWRTSLEVGVRVEAEEPETGARAHACSAYLTFVALDRNGRPRPLPALQLPECREGSEHRRARQAQERRDHRLQMRELRRRTA
ncbi:MAG: acyl-CoA thioesterase [Candidatus Schekmanbacteria bacterium]|nr:acyl-CoA thioesterase [Candidatus Schekmanbacteria bacterium]